MNRFWSISAILCARNPFLHETEAKPTARMGRACIEGATMGDPSQSVSTRATGAMGEAERGTGGETGRHEHFLRKQDAPDRMRSRNREIHAHPQGDNRTRPILRRNSCH